MKTYITLFFVVCIISCSQKDNDLIKISNIDQLKGIWKWESTCGGFTGECANSSNSHYATIEFLSSGRFVEKHNNTIYQQTNYKVIKIDDVSGKLILDNSDYQRPISITNNHLQVIRGSLIDTYIKIE
jgi:hypothetical protein